MGAKEWAELIACVLVIVAAYLLAPYISQWIMARKVSDAAEKITRDSSNEPS